MLLLKPAASYSKAELYEMIERLKRGDAIVAYELIVFTLAESKGMWHGRARAKICRYLKNHPPDATLRAKLVDTIAGRLRLGKFSEQFRDQLRMAIRFSPEKMQSIAESNLNSEMNHVRRYAAWVMKSIEGRRRGREQFD